MIVGTGIDIAEVPRIRQSIERFGQRFLQRIYTPGEIRYCDSKANRVVVRMPGGRPTMSFHGKAGEFAAKLGVKNAALSISHTQEQAIAQVILES